MEIDLSEIIFEGGDGLTIESAIIIRGAKSSLHGIRAEYKWVYEHFKKKKFKKGKGILQELLTGRSKWYDKLTVNLGMGRFAVIYFDITEFYGKEVGMGMEPDHGEDISPPLGAVNRGFSSDPENN